MEPGINHTIRHDPIFLEKRAADAPGQPAEAAKQLLCGLGVIGLVTFLVFCKIIKTRGEVVFFWQTLILMAENGEYVDRALMKMKEFQGMSFGEELQANGREIREHEFYKLISKKDRHSTRVKLNRIIPFLIMAFWVLLLGFYTLQTFRVWK